MANLTINDDLYSCRPDQSKFDINKTSGEIYVLKVTLKYTKVQEIFLNLCIEIGKITV
jgi:hypothetical protein